MAYNPTTWGSNDVITKDRLNKMEQGVRTGTLLSGTDIDADKNWGGKSITNLKISNVDITNGRLTVTRKRSYAASDNVLYSIPTEVSRTGSESGGSTLAHQIRVPPGYLASKFRLKFDFKYTSYGAYPDLGGSAVLKADGVSIKSVSPGDVGAANTWKTFSIDVENVSSWTLFQLYVTGGYANSSNWGTGYVRNTCICGTEETFTQIIGSDTLWG